MPPEVRSTMRNQGVPAQTALLARTSMPARTARTPLPARTAVPAQTALLARTSMPSRPPLVIGCGALAHELVELTRRAGLPAMDLTCLPASLHNRPEQIPSRIAARIRRARRDGYDRIFVAYADCGTGGRLDTVLEEEGVARLEGAHCYEVYAGRAAFATLHDEEPGTFYLTDYLVRNFERLVMRGLGLDRHPQLLPVYFGNYRRLVYLAQSEDAGLTELAAAAAERLGLTFQRRLVGLGELRSSLAAFGRVVVASPRAMSQGHERAGSEPGSRVPMRDAPGTATFMTEPHRFGTATSTFRPTHDPRSSRRAGRDREVRAVRGAPPRVGAQARHVAPRVVGAPARVGTPRIAARTKAA